MQGIRSLAFNFASKGRRRLFAPMERLKSMSTKEVTSGLKERYSIPKGILGQPTCHTHPHLIRPEMLTCGVTQSEYRERRETLVNKLVAEAGNEHKNHIIVIPAACKQYMSDKIPYVFRQNSDFFYLTGCLEPSAILVMLKPAQTEEFKTILFVHDKDSHAELWEGPRTGCAAAVKLFAVDETRPVENFGSFFTKYFVHGILYITGARAMQQLRIISFHRTVGSTKPSLVWYHHETPANPDIHPTIRDFLKQSDQVFVGDPQKALHFLRVIKSLSEIELMKETCYIGSQSVNMAMACTKPGVSEHMINAILEYSSKQAGAEHLAFPPVVAGGARATHIHYVANNQLLRDGEMILVDTGSQRWLYNSDISRTWPVSGKFSRHHKILYELVLTVQKRLIEILGEHRPPLDQLFDSMCRLLGTHLQAEGILPKDIDGNELLGKAYRLCPHHVSHYLGMDVHDAPLVRRNIPVQTNMVVTVEPGIYIRPDDESVPPEFRGVGIRIEDDVLITDTEPLVLTDTCVKEVRDIEAIVGKHTL